MHVKISAVIITYNEEHNIARCLDAIKDWVDEIVVVDSFSTDKTKSICETYNVSFYEHSFKGHIEQKNYAITKAKYPHILSLDADEVVSKTLKQSILAVKENWIADGYKFNRLTNYAGKWIKHCGWYPDQKLRLWDSRKGAWKGQNPHDRYEMVEDSSIEHLKGDLLHYSIKSVKHHLQIIEKFSSIAAQAMFDKDKKGASWRKLLHPIVKFFKHYILKLGWLDGKRGFQVCWYSAYATYLKYKKLQDLND